MSRLFFSSFCFLAVTAIPQVALAVASAEFYRSAPTGYGRVEARIRFAAGDGVVASFFLWKDGSEVAGTFWNELDFEKIGADCRVQTNAIYGNPSANHSQTPSISNACGAYHTYAYTWTPDAVVWSVDGTEVRRDTGATATAFADNASATGMQIRFNIWPGDASFGGNFNPSILPVHEYIDWVQFSSYANGTFTMQWREDFNTLPSGWLKANWGSPKNLSTHNPSNANIVDGHLVLSLTADNALGSAGAMPGDSGGAGGSAGSGSGGSSSGGAAGSSSGGAGASTSGGSTTGGSSSGGSSSGGSAGSSSGGQSGAAGTGQGGAAGSQGGGNTGGAVATGGAAATSSGGSSMTSGGGSGASGGTTDPGGSAGAGTSGGSPATDEPQSGNSDEPGGCSLITSRRAHSDALSVVLGIAAIAALHRRRSQNWLKKSQTS